MRDLASLPPGLPRPDDDGACDHLLGARLPDLTLPTALAQPYPIRQPGRRVIYVYPRTGGPGIELPDHWDAIPGARGCTPQSCSFRDHRNELNACGVDVAGLSAQPIGEQADFSERMHIEFPLINDSRLVLATELGLPTFDAAGLTLYKRVTMLIDDNVVVKVWYPVFPPDQNAADVLSFVRSVGQ